MVSVRKELMRCSVPSTTVQRMPAFHRPIVQPQCLCGNPVREGEWVRCSNCQVRILAKAPLQQSRVPRFLQQHTRECDCGRLRALEAPACPRCLWIDGIPNEEPIISVLRRYGPLTLWEIGIATHIQLKKAGPLIGSLLRKNRVTLRNNRYTLTVG